MANANGRRLGTALGRGEDAHACELLAKSWQGRGTAGMGAIRPELTKAPSGGVQGERRSLSSRRHSIFEVVSSKVNCAKGLDPSKILCSWALI